MFYCKIYRVRDGIGNLNTNNEYVRKMYSQYERFSSNSTTLACLFISEKKNAFCCKFKFLAFNYKSTSEKNKILWNIRVDSSYMYSC